MNVLVVDIGGHVKVIGGKKSGMLTRLYEGDVSIPAGRIRRDRALVFADESAAGELSLPETRKK